MMPSDQFGNDIGILTLLVVLLSYLLGSIPFGLIVTRFAGLGDIRKIGSGNIGATNVLRTGKKGLAALTVLLDGGKGAAAIFLTITLINHLYGAQEWKYLHHILILLFLASFFVVLGHMYPIWLRFKGGKGVATTIGVIVAIQPLVGLYVMLTWVAVAVVFRYSSLAALVAFTLAPFYARDFGEVFYFTIAILPLILWKHRANIRRLMDGTESRIGRNKNEASKAE